MGAWGTGLYDDDSACDARDAYREYLGDGVSGSEATTKLIEEWGDALETDVSFWLGLADTQWRLGRLEERVKARALSVIDDGRDLERWDGDRALISRRTSVLRRLRERLVSPQPAAKRVRKSFRDSTDWEMGDLIAYTLRSGNKVVLHVVDIYSDKGGRSPICAVLGWQGRQIPLFWRLRLSKARKARLMIARLSERELPTSRLEHLGLSMRLLEPADPWHVTFWSRLDQELEEKFGLR